MHYHISIRQWEEIWRFLKTRKGLHTQNEPKIRNFIEGVWFILRTGGQWRLLPLIYGSWKKVYRRFRRWVLADVWPDLMRFVSQPDEEASMIDSTVIRAHGCAAGYKKNSQEKQALGRSCGGFSTKIHARVDALGNPLQFILTAGQCHDVTQAAALTVGESRKLVIADKGYDCDSFIKFLKARKCQAVIPPRKKRKAPRSYDTHIYKERHLIECFFSKIKHFRRVFSRFDKTAASFLAFVYFASTLIWLR